MNTYVTRIEVYANDLGTQKDTKDLRKRIDKGRNATKNLCQDIKQILSEKEGVPKNDQITLKKLTEDFQEIKGKYDKVRDHSLKKEKEIVVEIQNSFSQNSSHLDHKPSFINIPSIMDGLSSIDDIDQEIIKERNNELKVIEGELNDITDMFVDINKMLVQQGEQIDQIDSNIDTTQNNVEDGTYDTAVAKYLDCKRRCCCIWCCISCCVHDPTKDKDKKK
eukprot:TRINITY_DN3644_c0_g2_i1.p1 TRINITY_DN3644_c0_g2~~TRINITY_DN3644_c0_g2_i1.p1  ORF type:complete len:256 (-),score=74.31 TRINITY_DN3644_c0_g2_i1:111-773(-)